MCLFLYMDGDGSGKGTHLSFYITVMRGEHDDQLIWPFQHKVTMILEDQNHQWHITHCFMIKPDPTECNASFQRPSSHSEMNVAFGFPQFAPLIVLDNLSYVKDDILRLHCIIDTIPLIPWHNFRLIRNNYVWSMSRSGFESVSSPVFWLRQSL